MGTQILLTIPDSLYQKANRLARLRDREIDSLLVEVLSHALAEDETDDEVGLSDEKNDDIEQERAAFMAMHSELLSKYNHQYVAIYNGQLIDHDDAFSALYSRVRAEYPDTFVLIRRVEAESEPVYHFRSPRWEQLPQQQMLSCISMCQSTKGTGKMSFVSLIYISQERSGNYS